MNDLVYRLRALSACEHDDHSIGDEAAHEIDTLTAEIARLNEYIGKEDSEAEELFRLVGEYQKADNALSGEADQFFAERIAALNAKKALFEAYDKQGRDAD